MVQLNIVKDIRDRLYIHIQGLSLGYFHKEKTGSITSTIINDVEQLQGSLSIAFQKLFVEPINILTFSTLLFIISWKLALIAIIIIPLAGIAIIAIGKSIRRKSRRTQKKISHIMQILSETLGSIRIVKAFVNEKEDLIKVAKEKEAKEIKNSLAGMEKTASGLHYKINRVGEGKKSSVGSTVFVHYRGMLIDGTVFDSSYERDEPFSFTLGQGQVIPGWDEGIALLNKGASAKFVIPSDLAYGSSGAGGVIPPNATLIFEVELVDFS